MENKVSRENWNILKYTLPALTKLDANVKQNDSWVQWNIFICVDFEIQIKKCKQKTQYFFYILIYFKYKKKIDEINQKQTNKLVF